MVLNNIIGTLMQNLIQNTIGIKRWSITLSINNNENPIRNISDNRHKCFISTTYPI